MSKRSSLAVGILGSVLMAVPLLAAAHPGGGGGGPGGGGHGGGGHAGGGHAAAPHGGGGAHVAPAGHFAGGYAGGGRGYAPARGYGALWRGLSRLRLRRARLPTPARGYYGGGLWRLLRRLPWRIRRLARLFHRPVLGRRVLARGLLAARLLRLGLPLVPRGAPARVFDLLVWGRSLLLRERRVLHLEPGLQRLRSHRPSSGGGSERRGCCAGCAASGRCGRLLRVPERRRAQWRIPAQWCLFGPGGPAGRPARRPSGRPRRPPARLRRTPR